MKKLLSVLGSFVIIGTGATSTIACDNNTNHHDNTGEKDLTDLKIDNNLLYLPIYRYNNESAIKVWDSYLLNQNSGFDKATYGTDYAVHYYKTKNDADTSKNELKEFKDLINIQDNSSVFIKFIANSNSQIVKGTSKVFELKMQSTDNRLDLINFRTFWKTTPPISISIKKGQNVTLEMLKQGAIDSILHSEKMYNGLFKNVDTKYDVVVNLFSDPDRGTFLTEELAKTATNVGVEFYSKDFSLLVKNYSICDGYKPAIKVNITL